MDVLCLNICTYVVFVKKERKSGFSQYVVYNLLSSSPVNQAPVFFSSHHPFMLCLMFPLSYHDVEKLAASYPSNLVDTKSCLVFKYYQQMQELWLLPFTSTCLLSPTLPCPWHLILKLLFSFKISIVIPLSFLLFNVSLYMTPLFFAHFSNRQWP